MLRSGQRLAPGVYTVTVGVRTTSPVKNELSARFRVVKPPKPTKAP